MTNKEYYLSLNEEQRAICEKTYREHPLNNYIDWEAFFNSDDGNEMHFVKGKRVKDNELGDIIILDKVIENNEDYLLVYIIADGLMAKISDTSCGEDREAIT